jgi:hypothetical protein
MASRKRKEQTNPERKFFVSERNTVARPRAPRPTVILRSRRPAKMSEVLLDFIEPYREWDCIEPERQLRCLITLGQAAWNAALLPVDKRDAMIRKVIDHGPSDGVEMFRQIVYKMIERKETYFSHIKRSVLGFDLRMTEAGPYLTVFSTLMR